MFRPLAVIILSLIPLSCLGQTDIRTMVLETNPRLDKAITLSLRAASIEEVLNIIQAETGERLRPERDIAQDKMTIWVKETPARDVLRAIARCFDLSWVESEIGSSRFLRLFMDRTSLARLTQRHHEDFMAVVDEFDTELKPTFELVRAEVRPNIPEYDRNRYPSRDFYNRLVRSYNLARSRSGSAAVLQYFKLSDQQKNDLFAGKDVTISGAAISEDALRRDRLESITYQVERSTSGYGLYAWTRSDSRTLLALATFDESRHDEAIEAANDKLTGDSELGKELTVSKPESETPEPPRGTQVPKPGAGTASTPTTMSDGLLPIARLGEIPVVAQHISVYVGTAEQPSKFKPGERLAELSKLHKYTMEKDGDIYLGRSLLWHRYRDREIPEDSIKRWQVQVTGLNYPTFEALFEMGALTREQLLGLTSNASRWFGMTSTGGVYSSWHAIKFYNSLNPHQKRALSEGAELGVASLSRDQHHLFMQAFENRSTPRYTSARDPAWPSKATVRFRYQESTTVRLCARYDMRFLADHTISGYSSEDARRRAMRGMTPAQSAEYMERIGREDAERTAEGIRALRQKIIDNHPDVPLDKVELYARSQAELRFGIDRNRRSTTLTYLTRMAGF